MSVDRDAVAFAVVLSILLVGGLALAPGVAVVDASHGAETADFSVEPMDDRTPGGTNVKYGQIVVGHAGTDFRTLEQMKAVYEEGSFTRCDASSSETFGIDRGNTHDGYGIDESLESNVKSFSAGEDVFEVQFYGEDDFGGSTTHLNDGDALVSVAECMDNPGEPGWYQISGSTTGITESGEQKTIGGQSHYFWVCDCEDEAEARDQLGAPPSEPDSTPTPSSSEASNDENTSDNTSKTDEESTTSDGGSADETTPDPTPTIESDDGGSSTATPEESGSEDGGTWDGHVVRTPTPGDGDGFGGSVAVVAIAIAAILLWQRS